MFYKFKDLTAQLKAAAVASIVFFFFLFFFLNTARDYLDVIERDRVLVIL